MLNLNTGIHLHEIEVAVFVNQKLNGSNTFVIHSFCSFNGSVARGASCNCRSITLIPHCTGTHTEGAGHLTLDCPPLHAQIPSQPLPALLLSLAPQAAHSTTECSLPLPQSGDELITCRALLAAWPQALPFAPQVLILRTLPNGPSKLDRDYSAANPPYLTLQLAQELVARGIDHLIIDLPSIDRAHDEGLLSAHRVLFGLPTSSTDYAAALRPQATVTELAYIDNAIADGPCALQLQVPAWSGDALPSRPLLFALVTP
jgi:kynurenine formamidase